MFKLNRIEKLGDNFILVAHPYPQMEGELLLFQIDADPDVQADKDLIVHKDYSLRKRIPTEPKPTRMSAF